MFFSAIFRTSRLRFGILKLPYPAWHAIFVMYVIWGVIAKRAFDTYFWPHLTTLHVSPREKGQWLVRAAILGPPRNLHDIVYEMNCNKEALDIWLTPQVLDKEGGKTCHLRTPPFHSPSPPERWPQQCSHKAKLPSIWVRIEDKMFNRLVTDNPLGENLKISTKRYFY